MTSSSFMQSFTVTDELRPDAVKQTVQKTGEQTRLIITIPKKPGGHAPRHVKPPASALAPETAIPWGEAGSDAMPAPERPPADKERFF